MRNPNQRCPMTCATSIRPMMQTTKLSNRWRGVATIIALALLIIMLAPTALEKRAQKATAQDGPSRSAFKANFVEHGLPLWRSR
jgi:hypothetical protein